MRIFTTKAQLITSLFAVIAAVFIGGFMGYLRNVQEADALTTAHLSNTSRYDQYQQSVVDGHPMVTLNVVNAFTHDTFVKGTNSNKAQALAVSQNAVDDTNKVLRNSGVHLQVHLVKTLFLAEDTVSPDSDKTLDALANPSGAYADFHQEAHRLHADAGILFTRIETAGGVAPMNMSLNGWNGFAVVNYWQQYNYPAVYTYAHEFGHLLGLDHDRYAAHHAPNKDGRTNYGYVDVKHHERDVMSYDEECQKSGHSCKVMPYYSTTLVKVDGHSFGDKSDDAASFINSRLAQYAQLNP